MTSKRIFPTKTFPTKDEIESEIEFSNVLCVFPIY